MLIKEFKHFILKLVERVSQEEASSCWAGQGRPCQAATAHDSSFQAV